MIEPLTGILLGVLFIVVARAVVRHWFGTSTKEERDG